MNTMKSFWVGWGSLVVAGGGAYYFAKQQINRDRAAKAEEHRRKKQTLESFEYSSDLPSHGQVSSTVGGATTAPTEGRGSSPRTDSVGSPSQEAGGDPAPTRHAPATEGQRVLEKSKYEAAVPYKSPKGDRFS